VQGIGESGVRAKKAASQTTFARVKSFYSKNFRLGILGGGQLGRMLIQVATNYDVRISVLDPAADAPCSKLAHDFTVGDFNDYDTVYRFGQTVDVLTIEIEHVNVEALEALEKEGKKVYPSPRILRIVKDKGLQKQFYKDNDIATAPFTLIDNKSELSSAQLPIVQKMRTGGYDGKGVTVLKTEADLEHAFDVPSVLEEMVDFEKELSIIIARNESGQIKSFPLVEMEFNHEANLVEFLFSPAAVDYSIEQKACALAHRLVEKMNFVGLLAVEMFLDKKGNILVNEIAPRPHNSGHHTIEACVTSQYEQMMRAILNLPLGDTTLIRPAVMINLLGEKGFSGPVHYRGLEEVMMWPGVYVHLYGKADTKPFRKMGHVTVCNNNLEEAKTSARKVMETVKVESSGTES
jgi:5-(carboxyamino)imidazole ribonucleotide synthase